MTDRKAERKLAEESKGILKKNRAAVLSGCGVKVKEKKEIGKTVFKVIGVAASVLFIAALAYVCYLPIYMQEHGLTPAGTVTTTEIKSPEKTDAVNDPKNIKAMRGFFTDADEFFVKIEKTYGLTVSAENREIIKKDLKSSHEGYEGYLLTYDIAKLIGIIDDGCRGALTLDLVKQFIEKSDSFGEVCNKIYETGDFPVISFTGSGVYGFTDYYVYSDAGISGILRIDYDGSEISFTELRTKEIVICNSSDFPKDAAAVLISDDPRELTLELVKDIVTASGTYREACEHIAKIGDLWMSYGSGICHEIYYIYSDGKQCGRLDVSTAGIIYYPSPPKAVLCTAKTFDDRDREFDGEFDIEGVSVSIRPEYNGKNYTVGDFPELEITNVHLIYESKSGACLLKLTLKNPGRQNVIDAVKLLRKRADVAYAEPDYIDSTEIDG